MSTRSDPDVCVIGAGLAGGLVAFELARRGVRVVVLDAGPRLNPGERLEAFERARAQQEQMWPSDPGRDRFTNAGPCDYPLNAMRIKAVGGTTLHWTARAVRLHESDFEERRRYGLGDDWPLTYQELEPYYGRAERALNVAGTDDDPFASRRSTGYPLPAFPFSYADTIVKQAAEGLNIAFHHASYARNSVPRDGEPMCQAYGTCGLTAHVCPIRAQYTSEIHLDRAEQTGHATILPQSAARRLNVDAAGHLTSVTYTDIDGRDRELRARVFVLAAHAVESARLLLLSTSSRHPDGLANASGVIGRNFMEHPTWAISGQVREPLFPFRIGFVTAVSHQFAVGRKRDEEGAFQIVVDSKGGSMPADLARASGSWGARLEDEVRRGFGRDVVLAAFLEQLPDPSNAITLDPDVRDRFGDPVPRITFNVGPFERQSARRAEHAMVRILDELGATAIKRHLNGCFGMAGHQIGTCRMGSDPGTSVVDATLRAHEVPNLYVLGSGVFVTAGAMNPSLTIAALALRLADTLTGPSESR